MTPVPAADDDRTATQRRAQALADLARLGLDHALAGTGRTGRAVRPHLSVLVSWADLVALTHATDTTHRHTQRGVLGDDTSGARTTPVRTAAALTGHTVAGGPQLRDGTPLTRTQLDRIACDSALTRIVFGPDSQVLDVGRTERTFTGPRRTALLARDKHCRYPTCTAPPALCEGHHTQHWARDHGPTAAHTGILLCWYHHDHVHRRGIQIHRTGGRWVFLDRHGTPLNPDHDTA